jgi:hypothetical protein
MTSVNMPQRPLSASKEPMNAKFRLLRIFEASTLAPLPPPELGNVVSPPTLGR